METEICQTFDHNELRSTLEDAGYKLNDYGDHWRCAAQYRGGTNPMSLKIYKNSGVWSDFGFQNTPLPIAVLLKKIFGPQHPVVQKFEKKSKNKQTTYYQRTQKIEMDKVYPEEVLTKLFPNFYFYTKKGFDVITLQNLRAGLAGTGKMYRRIVFPIFDENSQIIGFSGRKIDDDNDNKPKWKHLGNKKNWVYPAFVPSLSEKIEAAINKSKTIIFVESIGDMMALHENGIFNVLVTFGLRLSPKLLAYLNRFSLKRIIIIANNDKESKKNNGVIGALSNYVDLLFYFNPDGIFIALPPCDKNDLADCFESKKDLRSFLIQAVSEKNTTEQIVLKYQNDLPQESKKKLKKVQNDPSFS